MKKPVRICKNCGEKIIGRIKSDYCSDTCKRYVERKKVLKTAKRSKI